MMTSAIDWQAASAAVLAAERILVVTHVKPDGDAIGSLLGLTLALRELGKTVDAAVDGGTPEYLRYLAGADTVLSSLKEGAWSLIISVDASDEERTGAAGAYGRANSPQQINLDHHPTNTRFGNLHLIAPEAASASEIVYEWLVAAGWPLALPAASALLTGVVTDTIGFRTSNVRPRTLEIAAALVAVGAPLYDIVQRTLVAKPYSNLELWKQVFPSVQFEGGIISAVVTLENVKQARLREMSDGGLVGMMIATEEAQIAAVFKEQPEQNVEISFRCKPGYDVASVAFGLGGGGHVQAAGVTLAGTLEAVRAIVMPLLQKALAEGKARG